MEIKRRIFLSSVANENLQANERLIRADLIRQIEDRGFQVEEFYHSGDFANLGWTFENARRVIRSCVGAVILAFQRMDNEGLSPSTSPFIHYEAGIIHSSEIPVFIVVDNRLNNQGVHFNGGGQLLNFVDVTMGLLSIQQDSFRKRFKNWFQEIENRCDVFVGYCGKAEEIAAQLFKFLTNEGVKVREWKGGFIAGQTILSEIESTARQSTCAIFLFTKDDPLEGQNGMASPRDNVIFEAGYFISLKGKEKVLIIKEEGSKMPADLGGDIYLSLNDRKQIGLIETGIRNFLRQRL